MHPLRRQVLLKFWGLGLEENRVKFILKKSCQREKKELVLRPAREGVHWEIEWVTEEIKTKRKFLYYFTKSLQD